MILYATLVALMALLCTITYLYRRRREQKDLQARQLLQFRTQRAKRATFAQKMELRRRIAEKAEEKREAATQRALDEINELDMWVAAARAAPQPPDPPIVTSTSYSV